MIIEGKPVKTPESVLDRYVAAVRTLNKEALLALYAPEMRIFDTMLPFQFRGPDEFAHKVNEWFDSVDGTKPNAEATEVDSRITDGLAYMSMYMRYTDVDEDGDPHGMTNRLTWVLIPDGDDWKILHEHTSVPLDESDGAMTPRFEP